MSRAAGDRRTRAQIPKVAPPRQASGMGAAMAGAGAAMGTSADLTVNRVSDDLSRAVNELIDGMGGAGGVDFDFGELPT